VFVDKRKTVRKKRFEVISASTGSTVKENHTGRGQLEKAIRSEGYQKGFARVDLDETKNLRRRVKLGKARNGSNG